MRGNLSEHKWSSSFRGSPAARRGGVNPRAFVPFLGGLPVSGTTVPSQPPGEAVRLQ